MFQDDFFKQIESHSNKSLPFVLYRKPNETAVTALLQKNEDLYHVSDYSEQGFVFAPFDTGNPVILFPLEHSITLRTDFKIKANFVLDNIQHSDSTIARQSHIELVSKGIDAIKNGRFQKVVLSRKEHINYFGNHFELFKNLLNTYLDAFVYCWYHPKIGLWLGASPETLISVSGKRFKTMALAGTQVFKSSLQVNWTEKEKHEQQLVTDYITSSLASETTHLHVSETKTVRAGLLLHLQTDISGLLQDNLNTILNKLHPTPAVCGLPVEDSKRFILDFEGYDREFYTGYLGELNIKKQKHRNTNKRNVENNAYHTVINESNLFVNLRCMQIKSEVVTVYVGGGITIDSNAENEWKETVAKAKIMKQVLHN